MKNESFKQPKRGGVLVYEPFGVEKECLKNNLIVFPDILVLSGV